MGYGSNMWNPTATDPHQNSCWLVVTGSYWISIRCITCFMQDELGSQKLLVKNHCSTNQWANGFEDPRRCGLLSGWEMILLVVEWRFLWERKILEVCKILKSDVPWCADLPNGRPGKQGQTLNFNYLNYYANPQIVSRTGKMGNPRDRIQVHGLWILGEASDGFSARFFHRWRNYIISSMLNTEVTMPHTVQAYSLLDPAPTYGNSNFSDLGAWAAQADGNCRTHGLDYSKMSLKDPYLVWPRKEIYVKYCTV